jgi:hypothetical protein
MKTISKNNAANHITRDLTILILVGMGLAIGLVTAGIFLLDQF